MTLQEKTREAIFYLYPFFIDFLYYYTYCYVIKYFM